MLLRVTNRVTEEVTKIEVTRGYGQQRLRDVTSGYQEVTKWVTKEVGKSTLHKQKPLVTVSNL